MFQHVNTIPNDCSSLGYDAVVLQLDTYVSVEHIASNFKAGSAYSVRTKERRVKL
jgi:hypothetical protein